jgi:glycogen phosphorylase
MHDGTTDIARAADELASRLPNELKPLAPLAYNYWWSWARGASDVFASLDPERWAIARHNPVRLLRDLPTRTLHDAAANAEIVRCIGDLSGRLGKELEAPDEDAPSVAFFCMEYAVHRSLPIFAGGLGVLGGDLLKEASDRRVPLLGVGLLYRQGYVHQRFDTAGSQHEYWTTDSPTDLPVVCVTGADGSELTVSVDVGGRPVTLRVWRASVGRTPLYLLDADHPDNNYVDRFITSRLYVTDRDVRLAQYALLGIGGIRALGAMGIETDVLHLNEGHATFAAAEVVGRLIASGRSPDDAIAESRDRTIFTTHTPVPAGNEQFDVRDVEAKVSELHAGLGPVADDLIRLGVHEHDRFGLTESALRMSRFHNGVSRLHGEVANKMWERLKETERDFHIDAITNGVHIPTWMAPPMARLLDRHLGPEWITRTADPETWARVDEIPDEELWSVRNQLRTTLVDFVRERATADRLARGEPVSYAERMVEAFDPNRLTLGFARRAATYKRIHLLILEPDRALDLLRDPDGVQGLLAGKAHPADEEAKGVLRHLFEMKRAPEVADRVAYLEDYDLLIASMLVAGCDVWLNLPRPPLEASGTSGMKAAMNGGLNLSVMDGWWAEAFDGANGWAIHTPADADPEAQDRQDANALFDILQNEVVPLFGDRDPSGVPRRWIAKVKTSLRTIGPVFNATRMLNDYVSKAYRSG